MPRPTPNMQAILDLIARKNAPSLETLTVAEARAFTETASRFWNQDAPPVAKVSEFGVPTAQGTRHLRLYTPEGYPDPAPCLLYFHGGGWTIHSLDTYDGLCRRLANACGFHVASFDYGWAPEHQFPVPVEHCVTAARWLRANATMLGADPERLSIGGDSGGANLAQATLLVLRDAGESFLKAGVLLYGAYTAETDQPSYAAYGGGDFILSTAAVEWFWDQYCPDKARRRDPLASPLYADLRGLPPLYVAGCELDPLLNDSERLVVKLRDAGVDHEYSLWHGVTHTAATLSRMLPEAEEFIREIATFLRARLAAGS